MSCDGRNHNLKVVYETNRVCPGTMDVVRWCSDCGTVVVDIDYDNRTQAGALMPMQFPRYMYTKAR